MLDQIALESTETEYAADMGLGGYLAGKSDVEHYASERQREELEIRQKPELEAREVEELLERYGVTAEQSAPVVAALRRRPEAWRDFMPPRMTTMNARRIISTPICG